MLVRLFICLLAMLLLAAPARADDPAQWTATKLRGTVQQQQADESWTAVAIGDVIPDDRLIRTLADGHAEFQRGAEIVALGTNTTISIKDDPERHFTTVRQDFGSLEVEASVQNVPHFEVDTPFLAAVVKGTHFIVSATDRGGSVTVTRGLVAVEAKAARQHTTVGIGQVASIQLGSGITVKGDGTLPEIITDPDPVAPPSTGAASSAPPPPAGDTAAAPQRSASPEAPAGPAADTVQLVAANGAPGPDGTIVEQPADPIQPTIPLIGLLIGVVIGAVGLVIWRYIA